MQIPSVRKSIPPPPIVYYRFEPSNFSRTLRGESINDRSSETMISMTRYYKFQICSQEEEQEGISLFWTGTKCVCVSRIFFHWQKRKERDLGEARGELVYIVDQRRDDPFFILLLFKSCLSGSGKLNFDSFYRVACHFQEEDDEALQKELKEAFRLYDKEGNGYIPTSSLREILAALDDQITPDQMDGMIAEIDTDGSGTVDFDGEHPCRLWLFSRCELNCAPWKSWIERGDYGELSASKRKGIFSLPLLVGSIEPCSPQLLSEMSSRRISSRRIKETTTICFPEERFLFARNEKSYLEIMLEISLTSLSFERFKYIYICIWN